MLIFGALLLSVGPKLFDYRTVAVLSNSMQPEFSAGDLLIMTSKPREQVRVGDVIAYHPPVGDMGTVTHRVTKVIKPGRRPVIRTQGDAVAVADPWRARLTHGDLWQVRTDLPKLGYLQVGLRDPRARSAVATVLIALIALWALHSIWRPARTRSRIRLRPTTNPLGPAEWVRGK